MKSPGRIIGVIAAFLVVVLAAAQLRPRADDSRRTASGVSTNRSSTPAPAPPPILPDTASVPDDRATSLTLVGAIQARAQAAIAVLQPARVVAVAVSEGEAVRRGQLLVQLDEVQSRTQTETSQAALAAARAQADRATAGQAAQRLRVDADVETASSGLSQAQDKLKQAILARDAARASQDTERVAAHENVNKAQLGLDQARRTLQGLEELNRVGGVSRNDLESARTQAQTARADLTTAQAQERSLEVGPSSTVSYRIALAQQDVEQAQQGVRQAVDGLKTAQRARQQFAAVAASELRAAQAATEQAQAGFRGAQALQKADRLISPIDGVAVGISIHAGEIAQPGASLLSVVSPDGLRVEALALARQIPSLRVGQRADVALDTRPGRTLDARIETIARVAEPGGRAFRVRFLILHPPPDLRVGQSARIAVQTR